MTTLLQNDIVQNHIKAITEAVSALVVLGIEVEVQVDSGETELSFRDVGEQLAAGHDFTNATEVQSLAIEKPDRLYTLDEVTTA